MTPSPSHRDDPRHQAPASPEDPRRYVIDRAMVREVDRAAIEEFGIPGMVLMENAARGLADQALTMIRRGDAALLICGSGNNGGDGYALARHLTIAGVDVTLAPLGVPRTGTDAAANDAICARMGIDRVGIEELDVIDAPSLVVDAIFGTGLDRPVTGRAGAVIEWINGVRAPVLAVDVPSGLDCDTGRPLGAAVEAERTVTFVALKPGFMELSAQAYVGEVVVADIGAPMVLLERCGRPLPTQPSDERSEVAVDPPRRRR